VQAPEVDDFALLRESDEKVDSDMWSDGVEVAAFQENASGPVERKWRKLPSMLEPVAQLMDRLTKRTVPTIVFCNTVPSCRAVEFHLRENGYQAVAYYGPMHPKV